MNDNTKNLFIIIVVVALIAGLYLIYQKAQPAYNTYTDVKQKTVELADLKRQIEDITVKAQAYEQSEKSKTKPVYQSDLDTSDTMSSFGVMFEDVIQSAKYNGLKLRSIEYKINPPGDKVVADLSADYNVCGIQMQLIGNYSQLRSYFQDIFNYPYLINLDKISVTPFASNKKILIADVSINIYSKKNEKQKALAKAAQELNGEEQK